ncbi:DUF2513 domain-containing protein [Shouchella clausii]|uniref:DUF2513 domain-containing protein n=1 Tax=Shouchella clausii TaxID=79880 RepID=UPI001C734BF2|nr:DUF2513 domain-containing protein [Shouchella clausii]MBX0320315.1 DUF2513 domain-containing protein [Shouchella clausii]MEB5480922.1 DUF2513 domain-containing protein [Shouchella clausii]
MKLNKDCIRDTLLLLEDYLPVEALKQPIHIRTIYEDNKMHTTYSADDFIYTINKLSEAGYLNSSFLTNGIHIHSLSYDGHEFLDSIRDDSVWNKVKSKTTKVAGVGLPIIKELGLAYTKQKLGL